MTGTGDQQLPAQMALAHLEGQFAAVQVELVKLQAADEYRRAELEAARAEAADARAAEREWQGRLEESRRHFTDLRGRLAAAEERLRRAEEERAAVITALGRRARRQLEERRP